MLVILLILCADLSNHLRPVAEDDDAGRNAAVVQTTPLLDERRCETGYVFIDGVYLALPYAIQTTAAGLTVNGQLLPGSASESMQALASRLENNGIVVAFTTRPLLVIATEDAHEFFQAIALHDPEYRRPLLARLPADEDRRLWTDWLDRYRAPGELRKRAEAWIQAVQTIKDQNLAQMAAVRRIDVLSYPLSIVGMIASVLALGHLLMALPKRSEDQTTPAGDMRATVISVTAIGVFSLLDLVWSILAWNAGQMRELNPLSSVLIQDPQLLIMFKSVATLTSCTILLALRRHYSARLASWWLCLVCTVLTFRWLMFNSMFLGS
jgi:hypothetical protein